MVTLLGEVQDFSTSKEWAILSHLDSLAFFFLCIVRLRRRQWKFSLNLHKDITTRRVSLKSLFQISTTGTARGSHMKAQKKVDATFLAYETMWYIYLGPTAFTQDYTTLLLSVPSRSAFPTLMERRRLGEPLVQCRTTRIVKERRRCFVLPGEA